MRNTLKLWLGTAIAFAVLFSYAGFGSCNRDNNGGSTGNQEKGETTEVVLLSDLIAFKLENEVVGQEQPLDSASQAILLKNLALLHQRTRRTDFKLTGDTTGIKRSVLCGCCKCSSTARRRCCWCSSSSIKRDSIKFLTGPVPDGLITGIEGSLEDSDGTTLIQSTDFNIRIDGMEFSGISFLFSELEFKGKANLRITSLVNGEESEVFLKGNLDNGAWTPGGEE